METYLNSSRLWESENSIYEESLIRESSGLAAFAVRYKAYSLYGDTKLGANPKGSPVRKQGAYTWHAA